MSDFKILDQMNILSEEPAEYNQLLKKSEAEELMSNSKVNEHIFNDNIHVTPEESAAWNNKVNKPSQTLTPVSTATLLKLSYNSDGLITASSPVTKDDIPGIPMQNITGLKEALDNSFSYPDTTKYSHYLKDQTLLQDYLDLLKIRIRSDYFNENVSTVETYDVFFYDKSYTETESPITLIPNDTFKLNDKALVVWSNNPDVVYIGIYSAENTWNWITEQTTNIFRPGMRISYKNHVTFENHSNAISSDNSISGYATFDIVNNVKDFTLSDVLSTQYVREYNFGKIVSSETDGFAPKGFDSNISSAESNLQAVSNGIGALPAHDFGTLEPTQEQLDAYLASFNVPKKNGVYVRNLFEGCNHQWVYNETESKWINTGSSIINNASDNTLGVVGLGTNPENFSMDTDPDSLTYQGVKLNAYDDIVNKANNKLTEAEVIPEKHLITLNENDEVIDTGISSDVLFAKPSTVVENNIAMMDENGLVVDSLKSGIDFSVENNKSLSFLTIPYSEKVTSVITDELFNSLVPKDGKVIGVPMLYSLIQNEYLFGLMNVYYSSERNRYEFFGIMVDTSDINWSKCYFVTMIDNDDRVYAYPYSVSSSAGEYTYDSDTQAISTFIPDHYLKITLWNNKILYAVTEADMLLCCSTTDKWQQITFESGDSFIKNDVKSVMFGNIWTAQSIPEHFLYHFENLRSLGPLPMSVTAIGPDFLGGCVKFNSQITLNQNITSIGSSFLFNCHAFNQNVIIPNNVTIIEGYFMSNCTQFNSSVVIPSTVTTIKNGFIVNCTSFDKPLNLPDNLATIGNQFMNGCSAFSQNLQIPESITGIGIDFMKDCRSLNHLTVTSGFVDLIVASGAIENDGSLTVDINSAAAYRSGLMLHGLTKEQETDLLSRFPNKIYAVGVTAPYRRIVTNDPILTLYNVNGYVYYCANANDVLAISTSSAANTSITLSDGLSFQKTRINKVEFNKAWKSISIPNYFLRNFDQLTQLNNLATDNETYPIIPSVVTSIGEYFLAGCRRFNQPGLVIPTGVTEIKSNFLSGCTQYNHDISIPSGVVTIGDYFMNACGLFNSQLTIPETVTAIGQYFMTGCNSITEVTIPASIITIGPGFMANAKMFTKVTAAPSIIEALTEDIWSFGTSLATDMMYIIGVTFNIQLTDEQKSQIHQKFPDRTTSAPYRKILTL